LSLKVEMKMKQASPFIVQKKLREEIKEKPDF